MQKVGMRVCPPCNGANSDTVRAQIQPQPSSLERRHCPQQPLISNWSITSDISQGPVTIGKNPQWPHMPPLPLAQLLQLQNSLNPGRIRVGNSVFAITSTGAHFTCAPSMPGTYLIWRGIWGQSRVSETHFWMFNLESLLIHFYVCLKFQRRGIDYVVSELGTWQDCAWAIMKEDNPFQTKNSCSQISS